MERNVGLTDQVIRMLLGLAICSLAFIGPQTLWAWLGTVLIFLACFGYCPIYQLLGINTLEDKHDKHHHGHPQH